MHRAVNNYRLLIIDELATYGLRNYCTDGLIPISNIRAEHIAKTIAIARKYFLFADTGATAIGRIFRLIETALANSHLPQRYLIVLLTEMRNVTDLAQVEVLPPWNLTPDQIDALYPKP